MLQLTRKKVFVSTFVTLVVVLLSFSFKQQLLSVCQNPTSVEDYTQAKNETVEVCKDKIVRGNTVVVNIEDYPDLFEHKFKEGNLELTQQYIKIFSKDNNEYISITSVIDYSSWFTSAIGIYQKNGNSYKEVFRKSYFDGSFGRSTNIELLNTPGIDNQSTIAISGDLGYIGCLGCRINWTDYYDWDSSQKTYVLANNKHAIKFQELLEDSENLNKNNNSNLPVSEDQTAMLLKAKKAIEMIMAGDNLSSKDVDKIVL